MEIEIVRSGDSVSVILGEKELSILDCREDYILSECSMKDLVDVSINSFPDELLLEIRDSEGFGTYLFHEIQVNKDNNKLRLEFICHQPNKYWDGKWGLANYLDAIRKQVEFDNRITIGDIELEDDWKRLSLIIYNDLTNKINSSIIDSSNQIKTLIKTAEISLGGVTWKKEYEKDEILFCTEILTPLLRRMKFFNVHFNHGTKEYGKDYTFSELTAFGDLRHYGLQAKSGNLSGGVNSQIE